jgi:hypothetical protein
MGVTKRSRLDCNKSTDLGNKILELKEEIAHKRTYIENNDADLQQIELNALIEQQRRGTDNG